MSQLTVVTPAYNEVSVLANFHARLAAVLDHVDMHCAVLYVDDGSTDATWDVILALAHDDPRVDGLRLSRNFGKEAALSAGLDHVEAASDVAIVIDADLQDPPELIPRLLEQWRIGHDMVYATRSARAGETVFKRAAASAFYQIMDHVSATNMPRDTGDFRLLSRRALDALRQMPERQRFMKGLFAWIGFNQVGVSYQRDRRAGGHSKWSNWRLWNLAIEGITSFSTAPLRVATVAGLLTSVLAFAFGIWILVKALIWGDPVQGYPSLMVVIAFLGGMQLLALGVIGEYIGRTYIESKQRPLYYIENRIRQAAPAKMNSAAKALGDAD